MNVFQGDEDTWLDDGGLPQTAAPIGPVTQKRFERPNGQEYKPRTLLGIQDIAFLRQCRSTRQAVLLYGPPGTGKSSLPEAAFWPDAQPEVHTGLETIICSVDTTEADFFGTFTQDPDNGMFEWVPGPLQRAAQFGIPLLVDEILLADSRVLSSTLYPLMDGRNVLRIPMNPRLPPITVKPGFFVIGAGNPDVPGANYSEALRDRFAHQIEVGTDWDLAFDLGVPKDILRVARLLDAKRRSHEISWSPQLRALLAYRDDLATFGKRYAVSALLGKTPFHDRDEVMGAFGRSFSNGMGPLEALVLGGRFDG